MAALGDAALLKADEASRLLAPVLQESNSFVCTSVAMHVLEKVPEPRKNVLRCLMRYLCRLATFSSTCSATGLAQLVGPVLLLPERLGSQGVADELVHAAIQCTRLLIE